MPLITLTILAALIALAFASIFFMVMYIRATRSLNTNVLNHAEALSKAKASGKKALTDDLEHFIDLLSQIIMACTATYGNDAPEGISIHKLENLRNEIPRTVVCWCAGVKVKWYVADSFVYVAWLNDRLREWDKVEVQLTDYVTRPKFHELVDLFRRKRKEEQQRQKTR